MKYSDFPIIPASEKSRSMRRTVAGVGVNDADYCVCPYIGKKQVTCPIYRTWQDMLRRCYDPKSLAVRPTYKGCTVSKPWHRFSTFRRWVVTQDWEGSHLDKDILLPGNKVYSSATCCFVSKELNVLLTTRAARRGPYPIGVCKHSQTDRYAATLRKKGLGLYKTPQEAQEVYAIAKAELVTEVANQQTDKRVCEGLLRHADLIRRRK